MSIYVHDRPVEKQQRIVSSFFVTFLMELGLGIVLTIATSNPPPKARPSTAATNGFLAADTKLVKQ